MKETYYERALRKNELRRRQVRRNKAILLLSISIIAIIIICLSFSSISSEASDINNTHVFTYYKTITIQKGDTLWSIAEQYKYDDISVRDYIKELKRLNALDSDRITAGYNLSIPYHSTEFVSSANN